jgi:hypothetical protein
MMGLHQLSPSRSFLVAYGTDDDPVERDSLGTAIGCLIHAGRLSNPRGNCQFKMNDPLRCYISETLTEPLGYPASQFPVFEISVNIVRSVLIEPRR